MCLILGLSAAAVQAQPSGAPSALIIDRSRVDRAQPLAPPPPLVSTAEITPSVEAGDAAAGVTIAGIRFDGTDVPLRVAQAAECFVGQPASRANLEALATAMSRAYAATEVALYTVLVPDQDVAGGVVRVIVAEGFVEHVEIGGDVEGRRLRLVQSYARRLTRERPLTRATMERYLSLIRDIPASRSMPGFIMASSPAASASRSASARNGMISPPASTIAPARCSAGCRPMPARRPMA